MDNCGSAPPERRLKRFCGLWYQKVMTVIIPGCQIQPHTVKKKSMNIGSDHGQRPQMIRVSLRSQVQYLYDWLAVTVTRASTRLHQPKALHQHSTADPILSLLNFASMLLSASHSALRCFFQVQWTTIYCYQWQTYISTTIYTGGSPARTATER
jgi:hypothetical protein